MAVVSETVKPFLSKEEAALVVRGLDVLRAQLERAIVKETDPVIVERRKASIAMIRSIVNKEIFQ